MSNAEAFVASRRQRPFYLVEDDALSQGELAVVVFALGLYGLGLYCSEQGTQRALIGTVLQFAAAGVAAIPSAVRAVAGLFTRSSDGYSDQLVMIAVIGAVLFGEYGTAVVVPLIMGIGHWVERHNIQGVQAAIDGLRRLQAREAVIVTESGERSVAVERIRPDDRLLVRPGETIAADGIIQEGVSAVDEASITGESTPRDVGRSSEVYAGSINLSGLLRVRATRIGNDTSLGRVSSLLAEAAESKMPTTRLMERCAEYYLPGIVLAAAFTFWITRDVSRVLTMLIVACPCALVIAGPAATIAALAVASRRGILIKNGRHFDALAEIDTVVFDKTGTLTHGEIRIAELRPAENVSDTELLAAAYCCAFASKHPLSKAVCTAAEQFGLSLEPISISEEHPGLGIEVNKHGELLRLGKSDWLRRQGIEVPEPPHVGPLAAAAQGNRFLGYVLFADQVRPEAARACRELHSLGIDRVLLLTGDRRPTAVAVAEQVGCDAVQAEMLPVDKLAAVEAETNGGRRVLVVGDGINDAPALAGGHVGIAMGARGSDIAIQSADVALMSNDLLRIPEAVRLARAVRRNVLQNIGVAASCVALMLGLGAGGFLGPIAGAVLHNIGTVLVLMNAARLLRVESVAEFVPRPAVGWVS
jgi:heavy metal translocating P-type ATPase